MRITFTGEIGLNAADSKNPPFKGGKCKDGRDWERFGCSVATEKNNRAYLEVMGTSGGDIKTMDTDNNKITISWADRNDPDIIKAVASYKKHVVNLGDERKEFITDYDFIQYLKENVDRLKGKFTITGQSQSNVYQGKISQRFQIQNIYAATEDTKNALKVTTEYFFNKESIDTADWAEEKKVTINGYISSYIAEEKKNMFVPLTIVFDCAKIDFTDEHYVNLCKAKLGMIGCELNDGKVKCKLKGTGFYSMAVILAYVNGSERVEFTEDMLTDTQREFIELGLKKLEDFRPAGAVYGERTTMYKLINFDLNTINKKDYSDGYIDTEMSEEDFMDNVYVPIKEESVDDVITETKKPEAKPVVDDDDDDLFS